MSEALALPNQFASWDDVRAFLTGAPYHQELTLSKALLPDPSEAGALRSLGVPRGQKKDWRFPPDEACQGLHVQDYGDSWHVHLDLVHPTCDLLGHIRADAPRIGAYAALSGLGALGGGLYAGRRGALAGVAAGFLVGVLFDFTAACASKKDPVKT